MKQKSFQNNHSLFLCKIRPCHHQYSLRTERQSQITGKSTTAWSLPGMVQTVSKNWHTAPSWQCWHAYSSCNSGLSSYQRCLVSHPFTIFTKVRLLWLVFRFLPQKGSWRESSFRVPKMSESSLRVSFWTNRSRQIGCKCWKTRFPNIMSGPYIKIRHMAALKATQYKRAEGNYFCMLCKSSANSLLKMSNLRN